MTRFYFFSSELALELEKQTFLIVHDVIMTYDPSFRPKSINFTCCLHQRQALHSAVCKKLLQLSIFSVQCHKGDVSQHDVLNSHIVPPGIERDACQTLFEILVFN